MPGLELLLRLNINKMFVCIGEADILYVCFTFMGQLLEEHECTRVLTLSKYS